MAEELDLQQVRANVMSARGSARTTRGDRGGFEEIEEAIAIFERLNSSDAQRPYNNLADGLYNLGELREAADATERMLENWKRFPSLDWLRWAHSQEIRLLYLSGRWEDSTERAERWIAEAQAGPGHYLEPLWRWYRGRIRLARGDTAGALEDAATAVEVARLAADAQVLIPSLAFQSRLLWWLGDNGAEEFALELLEAWGHSLLISSDWLPDVGAVLGGLGRGSELEAVAATVSAASGPTPWLEGGLALGRGDPLRAAEIFQGFGARPYEAEARLIAAREGLDADLPSAIAFFREVGATGYVREAEALLAKTRSA
jgi:tetratricopeptide (TPR) repeat protein